MTKKCQRCRRVNPRDAAYCYFDGVVLEGRASGDIPADGSAMDLGARPFTVPLIFPSGRKCYNFVEFSLACHEEPTAALELLRKGHFETFLAGQGRTDLASAAHAAARAEDRERGLDDFLGRLPAISTPAKLRIEPATLEIGTVRVGADRSGELVLHNKGMRLLYGSASCDVPWLSLGDGPAAQSRVFQFSSRNVLPVRVLGRHLRAFDKPQEALIVLESNGGTFTVAVHVFVPVKPFPEGVLAGAQSPRQLAHKVKEAPKEAAVLIEKGAVASWYQTNGWTYPVTSPQASGVAAVQQLFEALGLVKPPRVELSEDAIQLRGAPGQKIEYVLTALTQENRSAVAHASSDQAWLSIGPTLFRGRSAFLPLMIAAVPGKPGETLHAVIAVTANGNQRFRVPVTLTVSGPPGAAPKPIAPGAAPAGAAVVPAKPAPAPTVVPAPISPPRLKPARPRSLLLTLLPAVLLITTIAGAALRDYLAPAHQVVPTPEVTLDSVPRIEIRFHDGPKNDDLERLWLNDPHPTMRFGVVMLRKGKPAGQGVYLTRLTFDPWGRTNNTCLRFDGTDERLFGSTTGSWEERAAKTWKDDKGQDHEGLRSIWVCDDKKIKITQFVELVRGEQSRLLDTCRVRYQIDNAKNGLERQVGIRFLLDSFIGGNDGVPFTIPGDSGLCDTMRDLPKQAKDQKLPDFLQALEKPDLARPGTIAHLRLKLENLETPARVTLGAWPNEKLRVLDRQAAGPATLWNVPLLPLKSFDLDDSAIVIYWNEQPLKPGATREVGFEYGLWDLARAGGRLGVTVDGAFRPDGELTVIAYVSRSSDDMDETVTLTLPESFTLLQGEKAQGVPKLAAGQKTGNVPLTWKVRAGAIGRYELTVTSSSGASQTVNVEIRKSIY